MAPENAERQPNRTEDAVKEALDELDEIFEVDDPNLLVFYGDADPTIALVNGELRLLSDGLLQARCVEEEDIRAAWDRRGAPLVRPFSTQSNRFYREDFDDVAELEGSPHV